RKIRLHVGHPGAGRQLLRIFLEGLERSIRRSVQPVSEEYDDVVIDAERFISGFDHERAGHPDLFLQSPMRMVPVGAALEQWVFVDEDSFGPYRKIGDVRNTVHGGREQQTMPVNGRRFIGKRVLHFNPQHRALSQPNLGARILSIDSNAPDDAVTIGVEVASADSKTVLGCVRSWHIGSPDGWSGFREETPAEYSGGPQLQQTATGQANRIAAVLFIHRYPLALRAKSSRRL